MDNKRDQLLKMLTADMKGEMGGNILTKQTSRGRGDDGGSGGGFLQGLKKGFLNM